MTSPAELVTDPGLRQYAGPTTFAIDYTVQVDSSLPLPTELVARQLPAVATTARRRGLTPVAPAVLVSATPTDARNVRLVYTVGVA